MEYAHKHYFHDGHIFIDQGEFAAYLIHRYERPLFTVAMNHLDNREDAQDAVAKTLHEVTKSLDDIRGSVSSLLFRVVIRKSFAIKKANHRHSVTESHAAVHMADHSDHSDHSDLPELVQTRLAHLSDATRHLLLMRFGEDMSHEEIATAVGLSSSAVRSRIHRGVQALREGGQQPSV